MRIPLAAAAALLLALLPGSARAECPTAGLPSGTEVAELRTSLGTICLELLGGPNEAPMTVDHFVGLIESGAYDGSIVHRAPANRSLIQGGGFELVGDFLMRIPDQGTVDNEPCVLDAREPTTGARVCSVRSNRRGTVAMAKPADSPDGATTQWFINLTGNILFDDQNGGFTVFARVLGDGIEVAEQIAALSRKNEDQVFWLAPELVRTVPGAFGTLPILSPVPLVDPLFDSGCFDPMQLAVAIDPASVGGDGAIELVDDRQLEGEQPNLLSTACGTPLGDPPGAVDDPDENPETCPLLAAGVEGPVRPFFIRTDGMGNRVFSELSCAQHESSDIGRDAWAEDFRSRLASELVRVEDATVTTLVPEPDAALGGGAALLALAALRARRRPARAP